MTTEAVFEYRHKKFDQLKRSREDDSLSSESGNNSSFIDNCDSSQASNLSTSNTNPHKQRRINSVDQMTQIQSRIELMDLSKRKPVTSSPTKIILPLNGTIFTANNRIIIKTESIEPNQTAIGNSLAKRRSTSEQSNQVKMKEELIELNTQLPAIPKEAYENICKFRSNMVRTFPKKERSAKEQERRDKNTFACRKSRRVKKIEQVAVDEEYKGYKDTNLRMAEYAIRAAAYFKELMKMTAEATASEVIVVD